MTARILVVDDDKAVRTVLQVNLSKAGMAVTLAANPDEALKILREGPQDLVLTDVMMPGDTGIVLLEQTKKHWPEVQVVVMTGYGSVADAVRAMKLGAADYLIKPIAKDELILVIERALEHKALKAEVVALRREVEARFGFADLVGTSAVMLRLYEDLSAVADSSATVLIQGPTGTGKELLAHALHYRSRRSARPFVRVNCGAIPENLLESELFGHEKGSFTGAIRQHHGKFEQADGGTILLDEIGEIDAGMQVRLLRVLENGEIQRVGGSQTLKIDVRVVAATNKDLRQEVREGRFREDLYYRLHVITLQVPALKHRRDDLPLLVDHFVKKYAAKNQRPVPKVSAAVLARLAGYDWPGNVRQLEHTIERSVILSRDPEWLDITIPQDSGELRVEDTKEEPVALLPELGVTLQDALLDYEKRVIVAALKEAGGVQARAARRLGLSRSNLNYRIQRLGITLRDVEYE